MEIENTIVENLALELIKRWNAIDVIDLTDAMGYWGNNKAWNASLIVAAAALEDLYLAKILGRHGNGDPKKPELAGLIYYLNK